MDTGKEHAHSQLFMLRLWDEKLGEGAVEWRGRIQHVASGDTRYLRDWSALLDMLLDMMVEERAGGRIETMEKKKGVQNDG